MSILALVREPEYSSSPSAFSLPSFLPQDSHLSSSLKPTKEFALLNQVNDDEPVQVIRNGNAMQIAKKDVVVGDIVILNTGEEVPADGELLRSRNAQYR